jgi:hypothetical protein
MGRTKSSTWLALGALTLFCAPHALAEVLESGAGGFVVKGVLTVAASSVKAYDALLQVGRWWDPEHTYSGDSANLSIDPRPGGCFCEKLPQGGVQHMTVAILAPGRMLRLSGGLGPLQEAGVAGSLTFALAEREGATDVTMTYVVGGYRQGGFQALAPLVDAVLASQLARFKSFADTGKPTAPR